MKYLKLIADYLNQIKRGIPFLNWRMPADWVIPVFSLCIGYKTEKSGYTKWGWDIAFGDDKTGSLFRNGAFFLRLNVCWQWTVAVLATYMTIGMVTWFGWEYQIYFSHWAMLYALGFVGVGVRFSEKGIAVLGKNIAFVQAYSGPKLNGEIAIFPRLRFQDDGTAARGTTGANYGQAIGWNEGNK